MTKIGRLWAGKLFGTNTGNVSAELNEQGDVVSGVIRFLDDKFGAVVYSVEGKFDGTTLALQGEPSQAPEGVQVEKVSINGALTAEGELRGEWSSHLGTGGTFILFPHDYSAKKSVPEGAVPEQVHSASRPLGAIRLYADDLKELIGFMSRDFSQARVIVTYRDGGSEISKYANDFIDAGERLESLRYIRLAIQEPDAHGINRLAVVELNANGLNEVRVQGVQETWVVGKAESLALFLRRYQKTLATTFRKFGLNINGVLALVALALIPELSIERRFLFIAALVGLVSLIAQLHTRFVSNVLVFLQREKPQILQRVWPQLLSWLITLSATLVAAVVYGMLNGDLPSLASWF
ncbi:MAG: hypothetical protein KF895_05370 [Parvibaculum sp.]|nr:hypothetical protein [Parvibaculum sp.]